MATLDGSIVNIALPSIGQAFGIDLATVEWVVVAYLLVIGSLLLPFGRLGEVVSFRRVYLAGFAIFTVASVLCGARPEHRRPDRLPGGPGRRRGDAHGDGPRDHRPHVRPGRARAGARPQRHQRLDRPKPGAGPRRPPDRGRHVAGDLPGQRAGRDLRDRVGRPGPAGGADPAGASASTCRERRSRPAGLFALLLALNQGETWGWTSPPSSGCCALAAPGRSAFVVGRATHGRPDDGPRTVPHPGLLRRPGRASSSPSRACSRRRSCCPFLLQEGSGYTPLEAGLLITPIPITAALVAPFSGALSDRIGPRLPASLGIAILAVGPAQPHDAARRLRRRRARLAARPDRGRPGALPVAQQQRRPRLRAPAAPRHGVGDDRPDAGHGPGARDRDQRGGRGAAAPRPPRRARRPCRRPAPSRRHS